MTKAVKGIILSGLVFPGLGQLTFKCYKRGIALTVVSFTCFVFIIIMSVQKALTLLEQLSFKGGTIDIKSISEIAVQASNAEGDITYNLILLLIICCWIYSTIDAYLIGKNVDKVESDHQN